jgi:hypothetical protein
MANIPRKIKTLVREHESFRHVANVEELSPEQLTENGLYKGYPCAHGHSIRSLDGHWCYQCAAKIRDNICGFDLNYLDKDYKHRYAELWSKIQVGPFEDCWEAPELTKARIRMPSYRSLYARDKATNVTAQKAIYQCAWGDIGSMFVTRVCDNKNCLNPLHLVSSWNRLFPPSVISPFDYEFKPEKLMQFARLSDETQIKILRERGRKQTIQHPLVHRNCPDYDEEYKQYYKIEWQETK